MAARRRTPMATGRRRARSAISDTYAAAGFTILGAQPDPIEVEARQPRRIEPRRADPLERRARAAAGGHVRGLEQHRTGIERARRQRTQCRRRRLERDALVVEPPATPAVQVDHGEVAGDWQAID